MGSTALQQRQDIFELIREIPLINIIERYSPNKVIYKAGKPWMVCPFHAEDTASLSLKGNKWHCFGCQAGGDATDFVSKLFNLKPIDAARMVANDYSLSDETDKPLTQQQRQAIQQRQNRQQLEKFWRHKVDMIAGNLAEVRRVLWLNMNKLPNPKAKAFTMELMDNALDILEQGTLEKQIELIRSGSLERWLKYEK